MARGRSSILVGGPWRLTQVHNGFDTLTSSSAAPQPSDWQVPLVVGACCVAVITATIVVSCYCWHRSRRDRQGRRDLARTALISSSPVEETAPPQSSDSDPFRTPRVTDATCGDTFATPTSASWPRRSQGAESRLSSARAARPSLWASAEEIKVESSSSHLSIAEADMSRVQTQIRMQLEEALQSGLLAHLLSMQHADVEELQAQQIAHEGMSSNSGASDATADRTSEQESSQPEPEPSDRPSSSSISGPRSSAAGSEATSAKHSSASRSMRSLNGSLLPPTVEEQHEGAAADAVAPLQAAGAVSSDSPSPRPSHPLPPPLEEFAASFSGDSTCNEQAPSHEKAGEALLGEVEEAWLRQVFLHCDVRCSGEISFVELSAVLIQRPDIAARFGMNLRPDARGRRHSASQDLEEFFGNIDTDRTREISWSELYAFFMRHRSGRTSNADVVPSEE